jgi:uncharacterized RDD family membrane protein YckC
MNMTQSLYRAGFWIRTLAMLIDLMAALAITGIATMVMLWIWDSVGGRETAERVGQTILYGGFLAYTSFEAWTAGTPGKILLGMRIAAQDGSSADRWQLILRWSSKQFWLFAMLLFILTSVPLFYVLSGFMSLIVIVGCLFASNDDKLAWHDQWAGTAVYRRARLGSAAPPFTPPAAPPHVA